MSKDFTQVFNDLVGMAGKFVDQQKGVWDHKEWTNFITDAQKKGVEMTEEMKSHVGTVLESMKKSYNAALDTKGMENTMKDISTQTIKFIQDTKGVWDHTEWEKFLKEVQKKGMQLNDETTAYMGGIVESSKDLYSFLPNAIKDATTKASK